MIKLKEILQKILKEFEDARQDQRMYADRNDRNYGESDAANQAHKLGLVSRGFGWWADKNGNVVARSVDGYLVKHDPDKNGQAGNQEKLTTQYDPNHDYSYDMEDGTKYTPSPEEIQLHGYQSRGEREKNNPSNWPRQKHNDTWIEDEPPRSLMPWEAPQHRDNISKTPTPRPINNRW